ncbi:hypothetical protein TST_0135 [Thermosulfidibacter takaii ABI70S6]|uniref:Class III cytochrome C domain-containing protein n=1 Tax=Thermosulfidibacter takaii (strain DSM 17441 / JCM 13301 / NBRC 103674 / ABI70S6) TaxID=1298851 RepID=A0A0S3QRP0_THET7|nr:cytochrome c3 family protein [Thermosulfidibacter takaii]BAT70945.1 hypothetical protein TST_0135 [Thermosulfidibacter takaii ABI70S6]
MRKWLAGFLGLAFVVVTAIAIAAPPSTVTIDKCQKRKAGVPFNHAAHVERVNKNCAVCHHKWSGEGEPKPCFACHGCKKKGEAPKAMKAFHKNCKGCHKAAKKKGNVNAPTSCKGCHKG